MSSHVSMSRAYHRSQVVPSHEFFAAVRNARVVSKTVGDNSATLKIIDELVEQRVFQLLVRNRMPYTRSTARQELLDLLS